MPEIRETRLALDEKLANARALTVDIDLPLWMGTWLGVYPTIETLAAQLLAFCFVVGSYFAAEWMRKRELRRAIASAEESLRAASAIGSERDAVETATHGPVRG